MINSALSTQSQQTKNNQSMTTTSISPSGFILFSLSLFSKQTLFMLLKIGKYVILLKQQGIFLTRKNSCSWCFLWLLNKLRVFPSGTCLFFLLVLDLFQKCVHFIFFCTAKVSNCLILLAEAATLKVKNIFSKTLFYQLL